MSSPDAILAKVDSARLLLAEARDAGDAKRVADLARAAEVYARRQKLSEEVIAHAQAIKVDAMTLMGEFLKAKPPNPGARGMPGPGRGKNGVSVKNPVSPVPTLAAVGISKRESSDAQALAALRERDAKLHEKVRCGELTVPQARQEVRRRERREDLSRKAQSAPAAADESFTLIHGKVGLEDCSSCALWRVEEESVRLVFADPPYNIGVDYGDGRDADRLPDSDFLDWCETWVGRCVNRLTPDGSMWVLIGDEYAAEFGVMLKSAGLTVRSWVKWYETFGVNCSNKFNRCSRHLFYCVNDPDNFVFHPDPVTRPSDRQAKYGDRRADPGGKLWDDVWQIPRLTGTSSERIPDFPTQLPLALLRPIVLCSSDPGDLVLDPFNGSGTTGVAALESGRRYVGIEKQARFVHLASLRLKGVACGAEA